MCDSTTTKQQWVIVKKNRAGVWSDNNNTSGYDWREINAAHHTQCSWLPAWYKKTCQFQNQSVYIICDSCCPALFLSDGLCDWDQAEWRSGGLERSGSLLLPRGRPGGHRGVSAGALAGGPARSHARVSSEHCGAADAHTPPPGRQDHRLVWRWQWWEFKRWCMRLYISTSFTWLACLSIQRITGQVSMHMSGTVTLTLETRNMKSKPHLQPGLVTMTTNGWVQGPQSLHKIKLNCLFNCWILQHITVFHTFQQFVAKFRLTHKIWLALFMIYEDSYTCESLICVFVSGTHCLFLWRTCIHWLRFPVQ